ncbi:MAG: AMP-binding protein, partial [Thermoanaerobaculales bacterium]|nr:AMP-binding protein [Thermoanaerobaculales bacterium]
MSTAHDSSRPPSPADLGELSPSAAAERVAAAVAAAAPSRERDAAILALLVDRRLGDPLLPHLPLASLDLLTARCLERLARSPAQEAGEDRRLAWTLLDVLRRSSLLRRFRDENLIDPWSERILALVDASHFTFPQLFAQRAAGYGERPLFQVPTAGGTRTVSWRQAAGRVELIARSLLAVSAQTGGRPIAVVARNCLEMALVDLACLSSGIVNVMVPATSTEAEVGYILGHAGVGAVVVSDPELLPRVLAARERLPALGPIIGIDKLGAATRHVLPFDHLLARSSEVTAAELAERGRRLRIDDLATVMYTSGTTGTPKGIRFSHRNIVFKRFARALALPEIGEDDRFLCYLPLFHTFGRFLEMTGCVFWGATYCFARDPSIETLTRQMREHAATVLISIPMKWMQLYEAVRQNVDIEAAPDDEVRAAVRRLVGHGLRWGLSAAGYLDPEIFRFMQRHGIELMSGFGMTEATGGITMTPPGRYREDSLGPALPGIDLGIADDGELLIRGPYVMQGYLEPPDGSPSFDAAGWFHTGDLMERDRDGFIRIIDRKKEIYKNINGQTIAPQKIENLFRDFESVARVFLVGDHREFNTALIYPNFGFAELDLKGLAPHDLKGHFRSLVVSANSFLAPFERIVDFAVIERDFDAALGELTPKGTYRRKAIERSFAEEIRLLYRRRTLVVGGASVAVPNWLFQALGITSQELQVRGDSLELASHGTTIGIRRLEDGGVEIGSACYRAMRPVIDLGHLLATPQLWLGNDELVGFAPLTEAHRDRRRLHEVSAQWLRRTRAHTATAQEREAVSQLLRRQEAELADLHLAALLLASEEPEDGVAAVKALDHLLRVNGGERTDEVLRVLRRGVDSPSLPARRRALQVLAGSEIEGRFRATLAAFLGSGEEVLDADTISVLAERDLRADRIDAFMDEAEARCTAAGERLDPALPSLCDFLSAYGAAHPSQYRRLRGFFTRALMVAHSDEARGLADEGKRRLAQGFRIWLGSPSRVAVDPETGLEYRWEDVVEFSDEVDAATRSRILNALRATPVIREASFLFGASPRALHLDDILPGGIWIRHLGTSHGKSVYRMTVRTRGQEQLELALNLNRELSPEAAQEEINWLIVCSEARALGPLVEIFGGWWPEQQLWTEEFIPGETLDRALLRLARQQEAPDRLRGWWPFAAWAALGAYVDFWNRT